jgi:hypothetical protein
MMPAQQRFRYAATLAWVYFAGFASGVLASVGIEIALRPESFTDNAKFGVGTLIAIYAIFSLITGGLAAFGAFFAGYVLAVRAVTQWHWALAWLLGGLNAAGMIGTTYLYEADLLSVTGFSLLTVSGVAIGALLKPIGPALGSALPWYRVGLCQACGYDLRTTPIGGACPECGAAKA